MAISEYFYVAKHWILGRGVPRHRRGGRAKPAHGGANPARSPQSGRSGREGAASPLRSYS